MRTGRSLLRVSFSICILVVLAAFMFPTSVVAALRWLTPKKHAITVRLLMKLPQAASTTAGRNFDVFLAEQELPHGGPQLVKLSYEYLYYEPPLTQGSLGDQFTYKLRAFRDETCDESLAAVGRELGLRQASVVEALGLQGSEVSLPCYRTTPADYVSLHRGK